MSEYYLEKNNKEKNLFKLDSNHLINSTFYFGKVVLSISGSYTKGDRIFTKKCNCLKIEFNNDYDEKSFLKIMELLYA